jgi:hypothetical protein
MSDTHVHRMPYGYVLYAPRHPFPDWLERVQASARAAALRDYAGQYHTFGEGSEPIDAWASCTCGADWGEGGCTEREHLLARADEMDAYRTSGMEGHAGE